MMAKRDKSLSDAELEDALEVLQGESDRACAVLGAAHLDYLLAKAILKRMPQGEELAERLFHEPNAPLGTFSSRTDLAFAMGLIDSDTRSDLVTVRKIRNGFAHDLQIHSFHENDSVRDRCQSLNRGLAFAKRFQEPDRTNLMSPRNLFISTIVELQDEFRVLAGLVGEKPGRVLMAKKLKEGPV